MIATLAKNDLRNIRRDSFMLFMFLVPWAMLAFLQLGIPALDVALAKRFPGFNLREYDALILSFYVLLQLALLVGVLAGFLVLDERDDGTLTALQVTPLSANGYISYRVVFSIGVSMLFLLLVVPLSGMYVPDKMVELVLVAFAASLLAPMMLFFLPAFARNKVEGLALMKGFGILLVGPVVAWFISANWHWAFAILPTFWTSKAFWAIYDGGTVGLYALVAIGYHLVWIVWLYRRFIRRIYE